MEKIYFVTSNPGKIEQVQKILSRAGLNLDIVMLAAKYPEDESLGQNSKIALGGAEFCAQKYQKPVLVTDVGLFIDALGGWPGVNVKHALKQIGPAGILQKIPLGAPRGVSWVNSLAFSAPGEKAVEFSSRLSGSLPPAPRGDLGFGFDSIFIPTGQSRTLAEDLNMRDSLAPVKQSLFDFAAWYNESRNN